MKVSAFMARQYANPSGIFGRLITANLLNRANIKSNQVVFDLMEIAEGDIILEVGFGGGGLLFQIAENSRCRAVYGIERSEELLHRSQKIAQNLNLADVVRLFKGEVDALPFDQNMFNHVCSINTVYFWPDLKKSLSELFRVTRTGGKLLLGFGDAAVLREQGYGEQGFKLYTPGQIHEALILAGFTPDQEYIYERGKRGRFYVLSNRKS